MVSRLPEQFTVTPALSQPSLKGSGEGLGSVLSVVLTPDLSFLQDLTRTCWPKACDSTYLEMWKLYDRENQRYDGCPSPSMTG